MDMKLVNFLWYYFNIPCCFSRGGSFTDDHPDSSRPPTASSSRSDLVYSGRQQKSWKFDGYSSDNDVMPCVHFKAVSHYTEQLFVPTPKAIQFSVNSNGTELDRAGAVSREGLVN